MSRTISRYSLIFSRRTIPVLVRSSLTLLFFIPVVSSAGTPANGPTPQRKAGAAASTKPKAAGQQAKIPAAVLELQKRLAAVNTAQQSGDLEAIAKANKLLIGLALREMAQLRLLEGAFPQAVELYKRSLEFEDIPDTHVDLAVAYLRMKQPKDSIAEADKAIASAPENARGWHIEGKAWMMLKDYRNAAKYLAHTISLRGDMEAAYSLATCLLAIKEKDKAAMVFQDMVQNAGERGSLHVLFGRAYRDADYMDDAVREFQRALAVDPKTPHAHYFIGLIGLIRNEWNPTPEIRREMLAEVKQYPRDYLANYVLGVFTSNEKKYQESDAYLKISTEGDPSSPEAWLYMGLNAFSQGDAKRAEELLRKAITLTGNDEARSHYQIRKAYIALGRVLIESGRKEEAAIYMQKARNVQQLGLGESAQSISAAFNEKGVGMGAVMPYVSKEDEDSAISKTATGLVDPTAQLDDSALKQANLTEQEKQLAVTQEKQLRAILGSSYNDLGTSEARQKKYSLALAYFQEAERWNAEIPGLMRNIGIAAVRVGNYAEAVRALSKPVADNPQDNVARAMLGMSYYMIDDYANAAKTIGPLGDAAISDPGLAYAWGASLAKTGQLKEASDVLDRLEQQQLPTETLLLLGQEWSEVGDQMRAVKVLHRALEQDPSLPKAHYNAGLAFIRAGKPADAATEFEAELALAPDDPDAKYNLGYAYLLQSQREKAMPLFQAVISAHPEHADAQYQVGKILLELDQAKDAIEHLEAAARLSPDKDFVHYQLQAAYRKASRIEDADRELAVYKEVKARNRQKTLPQPNQNQ